MCQEKVLIQGSREHGKSFVVPGAHGVEGGTICVYSLPSNKELP